MRCSHSVTMLDRRHTVQSRCPVSAPTVTPMGLYTAASVIVAICDRSPHSVLLVGPSAQGL